jgi:hypothetical protein
MRGIFTQAKHVRTRLTSLAQLNIELAKLEGKKKATAIGIAVGLGVLAAVLVVYAIGFVFASAAAGLSEALPLWLSLLIVALVLFAVAAIAGLIAMRLVKKALPPTPTQAIDEAKLTVETLKSHA